MAAIAESPVMELANETPALEPAADEEQQPLEVPATPVADAQHVVPASYVYSAPPVTYSAAPVTYIAAPTMMAPPATVSHYTWNGTQYPSMEAALSAMMEQASKPAPEAEVEPTEEPKEELAESPEENTEVKKRSVKPAKKGCC